MWRPKNRCISSGQQIFLLKDVPSFHNGKGGEDIGSRQNSYQNVLHAERTFKPTTHDWNMQCISACEIIHSIRGTAKFYFLAQTLFFHSPFNPQKVLDLYEESFNLWF